jgi:undecaprenyl-phosphate 4-deoxy-4-formamido-L-arabinose transferase
MNFTRNFGQHNALLAGIRSAAKKIIVTMDDDLQHPPEEIPKLLEKIEEGFDIVYGVPSARKHSFWRNWASQITRKILKNSGGANVQQFSPFRAFRASIFMSTFKEYRAPFIWVDVLLGRVTAQVATVEIDQESRQVGKSNYTFGKLIFQAVTLITGFSVFPLRLATWAGFVFIFLGFILLGFVVARFFIDGRIVPGFSFLATTVTIFSGVQLFTLGIIGEYLARAYMVIMDYPSYVVRSVVRGDQLVDGDH